MTENRPNITDSIEIRKWSSLQSAVGIGKKPCLVKHFFNVTDFSYNILLYDGIQLWSEEIVGKERFQEKCKLFNPNIEAESSSLMERVERSLNESLKSSNATLTEKNDSCIELTVKSQLQVGIPFTWTFSFQRASVDMFCRHVTTPLTLMVTELLRRQNELFYLLERKDREIQDYKDQGTIASRKHLETLHFDKTTFQSTSNVNEEFLASCSDPTSALSSLTNETVCDLYRHVAINRQKAIKIDGAQANEELGTGPSALFDTVPISGGPQPSVASWANEKRVPGSVVNDNVDGDQQQLRAMEPPIPMTTVSPEEAEKGRREALRKRLDEENDRKQKKKKRKINL